MQQLSVSWLYCKRGTLRRLVAQGDREFSTHEYFFFNLDVRHPLCVGSVTKNFLCITHTFEHNYISPGSTVGIQLHVSALYVGHLQDVI